MNEQVIDVVFGEMTYKHRWIKNEIINLWNQSYNITVAAKAYSGKPITDQQRTSYTKFINNLNSISNETGKITCQNINNNFENFSNEWASARKVNSIEELIGIVVPRTVLFQQDGTTIILCDCMWDVEHGYAIQVYPEYKVGSQDLFL